MRTYKISICLLLVLVIVALIFFKYQRERLNEVKSEMGSRMIIGNIIQLEGAIWFQKENDWNEPSHVIEKVEDVIEGIYMTRSVAERKNTLSDEEDEILLGLIRFFERYPSYSGFPNHEINEKETVAFENLRELFREVGWGMNLGYSSSWDELKEKSTRLISQSFSMSSKRTH